MIPGLESLAAGLLYLAATGLKCSHQPPPPVKVVPTKSAVLYDFSKTQAELDMVDVDTANPYGSKKETHVGGLMSGEIRVEHQLGFVQERYETGSMACLHFGGIDVKINISPTIYVARENKPGSCRYKAILEHEKKHVEADRIVVNKYSKRIGESLTFVFQKYGTTFGPFELAKMPAIQTKLQDYIDGVVKKEVERMNAERMAMQQKIDSLEEYERVRKLCPNTKG